MFESTSRHTEITTKTDRCCRLDVKLLMGHDAIDSFGIRVTEKQLWRYMILKGLAFGLYV